MKKYSILFMIFMMSFMSCNKFLDIKPTSFVSPENYYNNENEANTALLGLYAAFNDNNVGLYAVNALTTWVVPTDEIFRFNNSSTFTFNIDPNTTVSYWQQCYKYINNCNSFLENIDKANMANDKREVMRGEALFLRAYIYFLLVSQFGDVPLKLESTQTVSNLDVAFTKAKDVYAKILEDMKIAEAKVNEVESAKQQPVRISKQVVRGILARVCLYMAGNPINDASKYQEARDWAKMVVDANKNALNPDYTQIWINIAKDVYEIKENMWEAEFQTPQTPYFRATGWGSQTGPGIAAPASNTVVGIVLDWYKVSYSLNDLYTTDPADVRKDWNIAPFYYRGSSAWETPRDSLNTTPLLKAQKVIDKNPGKLRRKYELTRPAQATSGQNFPILRYADVLLMYAEAENELNGPNATALSLINQVRTRAKCTLFYSTTASNPYFLITDKNSFRKAIQDERSRELCFEFTRRNDLIRWGIYEDKIKAEVQKFQLYNSAPYATYITNTTMIPLLNRISSKYNLLPIPTTEMSLNKLAKQNLNW